MISAGQVFSVAEYYHITDLLSSKTESDYAMITCTMLNCVPDTLTLGWGTCYGCAWGQ